MPKLDLSKLTPGEAFMMGMIDGQQSRLNKLEAEVAQLGEAVDALLHEHLHQNQEAYARKIQHKKTAPKSKK